MDIIIPPLLVQIVEDTDIYYVATVADQDTLKEKVFLILVVHVIPIMAISAVNLKVMGFDVIVAVSME